MFRRKTHQSPMKNAECRDSASLRRCYGRCIAWSISPIIAFKISTIPTTELGCGRAAFGALSIEPTTPPVMTCKRFGCGEFSNIRRIASIEAEPPGPSPAASRAMAASIASNRSGGAGLPRGTSATRLESEKRSSIPGRVRHLPFGQRVRILEQRRTRLFDLRDGISRRLKHIGPDSQPLGRLLDRQRSITQWRSASAGRRVGRVAARVAERIEVVIVVVSNPPSECAASASGPARWRRKSISAVQSRMAR